MSAKRFKTAKEEALEELPTPESLGGAEYFVVSVSKWFFTDVYRAECPDAASACAECRRLVELFGDEEDSWTVTVSPVCELDPVWWWSVGRAEE